MCEQTDIINQLKFETGMAILARNASALQQNLAALTESHQTFVIFEFYLIIKEAVLQYKNGDFLAQKPIAKEKMAILRWLETTLKNNPYEMSMLLVRAHIALYNNQLDDASRLFRQSLMLYMNFLRKNKLSIPSAQTWQWMLNYALFTEPTEAEGKPYPLTPLQLPDSLINKAPTTIITAYGNAPYIQKFAERFTHGVSELMPEAEILLVVGNKTQNRDAETDAIITKLQQQFPKLHFADETIPQNFQQKHLLHTYCSARRFTYLQDIITQSACQQLITIDIDLFIQPILKDSIEYVTDAPIGYISTLDMSFSGENMFAAGFLKVDNGALAKKYCEELYDYLAKKFTSNHLLWVVDQYALFHAWQNSVPAEERQKCRNINDCNLDESHTKYLHIGHTEEEQALFTQERAEKVKDSRLRSIVTPQNVTFDEQTLRPILTLDWDK